MESVGPSALIQSDFGLPGNFELVLFASGKLAHFWRDNSDPSRPWKPGQTISLEATGPGSIIQSDFQNSGHANFEVVVLEGSNLAHWWHDNSDVTLPWQRGQIISTDATGAGCIIQSDYRSGGHGNFEVVVLEGNNLAHWWHDNSDATLPWRRRQIISTNATGPGCIIQSDFGSGGHRNFEVVVPEGDRLVHYFHDNSDVNSPWQRAQVVAYGVSSGGSVVQGDFKSGDHGNFEVVVLIGGRLVHFWHDNSDVTLPWSVGQVITTSGSGAGCVMRSSYGSEHRNFEVIAQECSQSVVHYSHDNEDVNNLWMRDGVVVGEPIPSKSPWTRKVAQIVGEFDREIGPTAQAFNQTESRFGIRGADLGSSFIHDAKQYFLFGDTSRTYTPKPPKSGMTDDDRQQTLDSIAFSTDFSPTPGVTLEFNAQFPLVEDIAQGGFDVPIEGFSANGAMYVFFSTDHSDNRIMGRTVLARSSDGGQNFGTSLYTFSSDKFINVSVSIVDSSKLPGLPDQNGDALLIFGSGRYRASDLCLAYLPLSAVEDASRSQIRYFSGFSPGDPAPFWSPTESVAASLFCAGDIGEVSVRWSHFLQSWLCLYNSGNPRGIVVRTAPLPWGPWSGARLLFDPVDGYCRFMHRAWDSDPNSHCDAVMDDMWHPGSFRTGEWGGEYGPYQMTPFETGVRNAYAKMYFTLSTWNPYAVMEMTGVILADGAPDLDPGAYAVDSSAPNDRKYANVSVFEAQIASTSAMSWDASGQGSLACSDHIEWAQYQTTATLRSELQAKFAQMMTKLADPSTRADAYARISVRAASLGADGPNDGVGYQAHYDWAIQSLQNGHPEWLLSEMNIRLAREHLLPTNDDWCYAYVAEAMNDRKYGRVSMLMARLASGTSMTWDDPAQGVLQPDEHVGWARLRPAQVLRDELNAKFAQMVRKIGGTPLADVYAQVTDAIVTLGADGPKDFVNYGAHYGWAQSAIVGGHPEWLTSETALRIARKHFLGSLPTT